MIRKQKKYDVIVFHVQQMETFQNSKTASIRESRCTYPTIETFNASNARTDLVLEHVAVPQDRGMIRRHTIMIRQHLLLMIQLRICTKVIGKIGGLGFFVSVEGWNFSGRGEVAEVGVSGGMVVVTIKGCHDDSRLENCGSNERQRRRCNGKDSGKGNYDSSGEFHAMGTMIHATTGSRKMETAS